MTWRCGTVSVLIRTLNEAELLRNVLEAIARQRCDGGTHGWVETVVVDSGSTDGSPTIAGSYGARVVMIARQDFTYGRALNVGIRACRGDLVAILSGHAVPASDTWLASLVRPLLEDPVLAGVFGRQLDWAPRSTPLDAAAKVFYGVSSPWPARFGGAQVPWFSNANACIRRSVALAVPFDEQLNGGEDRAWAAAVQRLGWSTGYSPDAPVWHSHGVTLEHMLRRLQVGAPLLSSG